MRADSVTSQLVDVVRPVNQRAPVSPIPRVLVVEDEYFIALDIEKVLRGRGLEVVGPMATCEEALAVASNGMAIQAAILDVNLQGSASYELADLLRARGVPIMFVTGYDRDQLPPRFQGTPYLAKPFATAGIAANLRSMLPNAEALRGDPRG